MSRTTKIIIAFCFLLLLGGGIWSLAPQPAGTPEQQIADSLQDAADAARAGNIPRLMEGVSNDFKSGMLNKPRLQALLLRARNGGQGVAYDVRVTPPRVLADQSGAANRRLVFTSAAVLGDGNETLWGGNQLTLVMRQETQRHNLFFTVPRWRILSIANLPPLSLDGGE